MDDETPIRLSTSKSFGSDFWREVAQMYFSGKFCDLDLSCRDGSRVSCHRLVLALVSPFLAQVLEGHLEGENKVLLLHDFEPAEVRDFLDALYDFLQGRDCPDVFDAHPGIVESLQLDLAPFLEDTLDQESLKGPDVVIKEEAEEVDSDAPLKPLSKRRKGSSASGKRRRVGGGGRGAKRRKKTASSSAERLVQAEVSSGTSSPNVALGELEKQLKHRTGALVAKLEGAFDYRVHCRMLRRARFAAAVGARAPGSQEDPAGMEALPLAWSAPATELMGEGEMARQYGQYCGALRSVLGLSKVETYHQPNVIARMGTYTTRGLHGARIRKRREYAFLPREDLEAILRKESVVSVSETRPQRRLSRCADAAEGEGEAVFRLLDELAVEELEGVALLYWDGQEGGAKALLLRLNSEARETYATEVAKALFDIWFLRKPKGSPTEKCREIIDIFQKHLSPAAEYLAAKEVLGEGGDKVRKLFVGREEVCSECGLIFKTTTYQEYAKYENHRKLHRQHRFRCDCEVTWTTLVEKRRHINVVHRGYLLCHSCDFVAKDKGILDAHVEREHEECICQLCGMRLVGKRLLNMHMADNHPDEISDKLKERKILKGTCDCCGKSYDTPKKLYVHYEHNHKPIKCKLCGDTVVGINRKRVHMREMHRSTTQTKCGHCGVTISRRGLPCHILNMHTPEERRPHACPDCPRRFSTRGSLRQHQQLAHIKSRPFGCRYGCEKAYNDTRSRSNHERIKHGRTYYQAVKMGLVPPK